MDIMNMDIMNWIVFIAITLIAGYVAFRRHDLVNASIGFVVAFCALYALGLI